MRLDVNLEDLVRLRISIHAPMKGAADYDPYIMVYDKISIHAPMKGAATASLR